jgi:hypothetical protein
LSRDNQPSNQSTRSQTVRILTSAAANRPARRRGHRLAVFRRRGSPFTGDRSVLFGIALSPDEKSLVYSVGENMGSNLMLVE